MPSGNSSDVKFEIGHVLFIDIVGYSKLLIDEQSEHMQMLREIVRGTEQFRLAETAGKLLRLPTGDGGALVFRTSLEAPVLCALEISKEVKKHPELRVRMGIHSGPVNEITDLNEQANIAGAGINIAQRVMDCGDAGHILLSKHVAEDLEQYRQWQPHLRDLGECEMKHGVRVSVVNLYTDDVGNAEVPEKFRQAKEKEQTVPAVPKAAVKPAGRSRAWIAALIIAAIAAAGFYIFSHRSGSTPIVEKSVAVLPFENLSRDPDNAYFADGIQEEILTRLAEIADLKVISRTSTQQYQSKPGNLSEIAKQLGVANILEGGVQKAGDSVRVNVQLIHAATDSHLWADTYDRRLIDIFGVESEIAKAIAESLQAKLSGGEQQALAIKPTDNAEAYDAYLRGLSSEARGANFEPNYKKAASLYERSVQLDPAFALAWGRLSRAESYLYHSGTFAALEAAERALKAAQKLQPNSPEILLAQGYYQYWVLEDYDLAKVTFALVRNVLPGSSDASAALALIARRQGRWDESISYYKQALTLDPRNSGWLADWGRTYSMLRQFPAALKALDRALDIEPNEPDLIAEKAQIYQAEGNLEQARKLLAGVDVRTAPLVAFATNINQLSLERRYDEAIRLLQIRLTESHEMSDSERAFGQLSLVSTLQFEGDAAGARAIAQQAQRTLETFDQRNPENARAVNVGLSLVYATLGQKDAALKHAERAVALLPSSKDTVAGPAAEENLAGIEVMVGEKNSAIARLRHLLETPYASFPSTAPLTPALLRLDPTWDPLRSDPRFQKLAESAAPK